MNHARLSTSPRLQRVLRALREARGEITPLELTLKARVAAVGTAISELRANGAVIDCRQALMDGERRFFYRLIKEPS